MCSHKAPRCGEPLNVSRISYRMHEKLPPVVASGERAQDLRSEADILVNIYVWLDTFTLGLQIWEFLFCFVLLSCVKETEQAVN